MTVFKTILNVRIDYEYRPISRREISTESFFMQESKIQYQFHNAKQISIHNWITLGFKIPF